MTNFTMIRGDTWTATASILDENGNIFNFTNCTVWFTIKGIHDRSLTDDNALVKLYWVSGGLSSGITISSPTSGNLTITLTPTQTETIGWGDFIYDIQILDALGKYSTLEMGTISITPDVTRRRTTP